MLPEAGKLTIKYDDSGVSVVTEGAVSETTFAHLTDLLLDNAETEAGGIDRGDDAALMASMDPSNFDDAKLMKVRRSLLVESHRLYGGVLKISSVMKAFHALDDDNSGFVDGEEFGRLCRKLDPKVTDKMVAMALEAIDDNGDGQVGSSLFSSASSLRLGRLVAFQLSHVVPDLQIHSLYF